MLFFSSGLFIGFSSLFLSSFISYFTSWFFNFNFSFNNFFSSFLLFFLSFFDSSSFCIWIILLASSSSSNVSTGSITSPRYCLWYSGTKGISLSGIRIWNYFALSSGKTILGIFIYSYGITDKRWWIQSRKACLGIFESTIDHGQSSVLVYWNMISFALVKSFHLSRCWMSRDPPTVFHLSRGFRILSFVLLICSSSDTDIQYFMSIIPDCISNFSKTGQDLKNCMYSFSVQNPSTLSTPARLYQDRSNRTISPDVGKCSTNLWKYHCVCCSFVGFPGANTRQNRGERYFWMYLIMFAFPARSLPSKSTTIFAPVVWAHN